MWFEAKEMRFYRRKTFFKISKVKTRLYLESEKSKMTFQGHIIREDGFNKK